MFSFLSGVVLRRPWAIVLAWLALTSALYVLGPRWEDVTKDDDVRFFPAGSTSVIKAHSPPGRDGDNRNTMVWTILVTSDKMADEMAYDIVNTIFERKVDLVAVHQEAENFDLKYQVKGNSPAPWLPGALKYFAEKGVNL